MVVITGESLTQRNKFVLTRECRAEVLLVLSQVLLDDPGDEASVEAGEDWLVDPCHVTLSGQGNPLAVILTVGETDVLVIVKLPGQLLDVGQHSTGVGLLIAMVVLVAEVIYYRKQEKPRIKSIKTVGNFIRVSPSNTHSHY